jgi:hypothetical protein
MLMHDIYWFLSAPAPPADAHISLFYSAAIRLPPRCSYKRTHQSGCQGNFSCALHAIHFHPATAQMRGNIKPSLHYNEHIHIILYIYTNAQTFWCLSCRKHVPGKRHGAAKFSYKEYLLGIMTFHIVCNILFSPFIHRPLYFEVQNIMLINITKFKK